MNPPHPHNSAFAVQETGSGHPVKHRTPGERWFGYLKYIAVGFLANIGLSYFIGRDGLLFQENELAATNGKKPVGRTFLWDKFHHFNENLRMRMIVPISKMIENMPENMRINPDPGIYSDLPADASGELIHGRDTVKLADHASKTIMNAILLAWGGTLVSFAMYRMEKNRLGIVKTLDRLYDKYAPIHHRFFHIPHSKGPPSGQEIAERDAAYRRIEKESKYTGESFFRIMGTRVLALCAAVGTSATAMYVDRKRKGLERLEHGILTQVNKMEKKFNAKLWFTDDNPNVDSPQERLFSLAFLETIVGAYSSGADYLRNNAVQKKIAEEEAREAAQRPVPPDDPCPKRRILDYSKAAADFRSRHAGSLKDSHLTRLAFSRDTVTLAAAGGI